MTFNRCQRNRNISAIERSSIHQSLLTPSSQIAMARSKQSTLNDPKQALDLVRSLIQTELNEKIQIILQDYVDTLFQPAINNVRKNLGNVNVSSSLLLEEVCCSALDHAKVVFKSTKSLTSETTVTTASLATRLAVKRKLTQSIAANNAKKRALHVSGGTHPTCKSRSDLPLVTAEGKPVRREGPKWDAKRINHETLFVLGSKACKLLGYKRGSGRLYSTHPTLFKYTLDQDDKEKLIENSVIPFNSSGKRVNVVIAEDIIEIADNMESSVQATDILGHAFKCPPIMIDKMKIFIDLVKTDPSESDEMLLKKVSPITTSAPSNLNNHSEVVNEFMNDIKSENESAASVSEEDLGFLQNMNLTSLVRKFEMEAANAAASQGSQNLGILSLADDDVGLEDLDNDHHTVAPANGSLNDIEFE